MEIKYRIEIEWCPQDRLYIASVPELGYCKTHATTLTALFGSLEEAVEGHLEVMRQEGQRIPVPKCESMAS